MGETLTTHIGGELVELPGTIDAIRAALPAADREEFDRAIGQAAIEDVPLIAARWALPPEAVAEDDAAIARLKAGDRSGFAPLDADAYDYDDAATG